MLLNDIKKIFHQELDTLYPKEEVASFFSILIEELLGLERFVLALRPELMVSKKEGELLFNALSQLRLYRPLQYILGQTSFMELDFMVNEAVLVPRPETQDLVQWVLDDLKVQKEKLAELTILDIGTGSGCIAITLAKNLPHAKVYGLDVSEKALQVAQKNAAINDVEITWIHRDILKEQTLETNFDIIVSNPPYVREVEKAQMHQNVLSHEPDLALFVSNENPLLFYKTITAFALKNLNKKGCLFFEINQYLAKETQQLLEKHNFSEIELRKDLFGNERMLRGVFMPG